MSDQKFRVESDLLGELKVPADALYGVQTQRGINNYHISRKTMSMYPDFIIAIAYVKLAAVETNHTLGVISDEIAGAISQACREIIDGKWHDNFPIDMMQGGAGTSVNMNANEVIANRALEIMGHEKGDYQYCYPNDHCNCGQSTNDVYPTTIRLALIRMNKSLVAALTGLISAFRYKGEYIRAGSPRNDLLVRGDPADIRRVRAYLDLATDWEKRNAEGVEPVRKYLDSFHEISSLPELTGYLINPEENPFCRMADLSVTLDLKDTADWIVQIREDSFSILPRDFQRLPEEEIEETRSDFESQAGHVLRRAGYPDEEVQRPEGMPRDGGSAPSLRMAAGR